MALQTKVDALARFVGPASPEHERALRGLKALREGRLHDVESNISAIPDAPVVHLVWKLVLSADLALERGLANEAEACALQALGGLSFDAMKLNVNSALAATKTERLDDESEIVRLSGVVLIRLGQAYRRLERVKLADCAHQAALRLFEKSGSLEDQWSACRNLALDAEVEQEYKNAIAWHEKAVQLAAQCAVDRDRLHAITLHGLARCRLANGEFERAVADSRSAYEEWCHQDRGGWDAVRADRDLGEALLCWGKSLFDAEPTKAGDILREAAERLKTAQREMAAFESVVADLVTCEE
ncbi:MAG: tetratricopeptide repeat protein, partial [Planctomycetota bacterium]